MALFEFLNLLMYLSRKKAMMPENNQYGISKIGLMLLNKKVNENNEFCSENK